jgi:hypothetical protein
MAVEGTDLPFDLAGERVIPYTLHVSDVDRAKEDLAAQIKRVLEPGYKPRNPILDAIGLITLDASNEPTQQALATLTREMQNLRGDVAALRSGSSNTIYVKDIVVPLKNNTFRNMRVTSNRPFPEDFPPLGGGILSLGEKPPEPDRDSEQKEKREE